MLELIMSLLMALGLFTSHGPKPIIVIDQTTGISYGIGTSNGAGGCVVPPDVYYLVKDPQGRYHLVKK